NQLGVPENGATFQAVLQLNSGTADGVVTLNYRDLDVGSTTADGGGSATVGIRAADAAGPAHLLISFDDGLNPLVGNGRSIRIFDNTPPKVSVGPAATIDEGKALSRNGSFTDLDPGQTWTATVDYGDGAGSQPLALNADKSFDLAHTYSFPG